MGELIRRDQEFRETGVGQAFLRYESAMITRALRDGWISDLTSDEVNTEAEQARAELIALLRPLIGLEP